MKTIYIGDSVFKVEVVKSPSEMKLGLSKHTSLAKGHGMIFDFGESQRVTMNMFDMKFSLDMLFINKNKEVFAVEAMHPGDNEVTYGDVKYVLEVNAGEGVTLLNETVSNKGKTSKNILISEKDSKYDKMQQGGAFQMNEEAVSADPGKMQVLDDTGTILMNIKGGERIFSIKHTEDLMKLANKVKQGELEPEELGKLMKKIINIQDTQKPEYVD